MSRKDKKPFLLNEAELVSLACTVFLTPVARNLKYPASPCQPGSAARVTALQELR